MSFTDLENCRICETEVPLENIFQIFDNTSSRLLEQVCEISGVNFKGVFEQPWFICMKCYTDLLTAQGFRRKCIDSYENRVKSKTNETVSNINKFQDDITDLPSKMLLELTETEYPNYSKNCEKNTTPETDNKISKICEICGNVFQTRRNFALHLRRHTQNKRFECELCFNKFHTNAELKCHMRRHTGEKPYECQYCNRKFSDYGTHKKHERTHTNDRPFSCDFCNKAFTSTFILKNHVLTHTGKRAFECKVCKRSFVHLGHLTSHLKSLFHLRNCKRAELENEESK